MKKTINWILLITFFWFISFGNISELYAQEAKRTTIAVLNINSRGGVSPSEAQTLSDRLRSELVNTQVFTVVERGQMDAILKEQGFNLSGCTSSECAVEVGRLLGVQQMVTGDVGKLGGVITIDIRVFDVQSGKIISAHQSDYKGNVEGLLGLIRSIAQKIAGTYKEEKKGKFPWLWVSAGVVVLGGAAALLLSGGGDGDEPPETSGLPNPDWPPDN